MCEIWWKNVSFLWKTMFIFEYPCGQTYQYHYTCFRFLIPCDLLQTIHHQTTDTTTHIYYTKLIQTQILYTHLHTHTHTHMKPHGHIYTKPHTYTDTYQTRYIHSKRNTHTHTIPRIHTYKSTHTLTKPQTHTHTHTLTRIYIYIYIYIYWSTYMYTLIFTSSFSKWTTVLSLSLSLFLLYNRYINPALNCPFAVDMHQSRSVQNWNCYSLIMSFNR